MALGIAFRSDAADPVHVVVEDGPGSPGLRSPAEVAALLEKDPGFKVKVKPPEEARNDLIRGRADLVVRVEGKYDYDFDPAQPRGELAWHRVNAALQEAHGQKEAVPTAERRVTEAGSRYIDFLIPGLIGMNIMGGGLWGVGFVIVDMRVRKLLKRFLATPMRKRDFLLSIVGSRMIFLVPEITLLLLVGRWVFGVPLLGSLAALVVIALASALCFSGMGLLVASRASKVETVSGLMNAVMLPMWILSGIFFNYERFPEAFQPFIQALPLTATIDSLRAVMLEGRSLLSQGSELGILAAWGIVSYALSLRWFRWL